MAVPDLERQIGIEVYATNSEGIGGAIRAAVDDFVVEEVLVDGSKAKATPQTTAKPALGASEQQQQPFLLCVLVKRNWDTFIALKNLARALNIDTSRIQIAGIKDAKAQTAQYITINGVSAQEAAVVQLRDIELHPVGYFREPLCPFYLLGNNFQINITHITPPPAAVEEQTTKATQQIAKAGGIPNFYGHQRFGTTRAITHLVGKAMLQGSLEDAAMVFLAKPSPDEHPKSQQARTDLQESRDFQRALETFPLQLRFERAMLGHLAEAPTDFAGAFRRLPLKLRMMFVQAWQSYLFNRFLSARIRAGFSLCKAQAGDFAVNVERTGLPMTRTGKIVNAPDVDAVNSQIAAGKMRVALPLFGSRQKLSQGAMGTLEHEVLAEEGVDANDFFVPELPEVNSKGELRATVCPVADFSTGAVSADSEGDLRLPLEFRLLRGAYATVLLREIMKPQNLIAAGF
ncbi:MAG: tRNA pseudouridine(13) synthase TruD [Candidatus Bathyarchaeota archaeon]|nr:tRNA pseudouridine(13) synthase TruD [Candidatus Bathyarchaeota archaeon]